MWQVIFLINRLSKFCNLFFPIVNKGLLLNHSAPPIKGNQLVLFHRSLVATATEESYVWFHKTLKGCFKVSLNKGVWFSEKLGRKLKREGSVSWCLMELKAIRKVNK